MAVLTELDTNLRLIRANNPSPMTGDGTNSYILGKDELCIIDPGPDDPEHLARILEAVGPDKVACILVTHSHKDHSPLAPALSQATNAKVMAFGDSYSGRSAVMQHLASQGVAGGGEGVDAAFQPDHNLHDGETVRFGEETITAFWTPGHMGNHMCFHWGDVVFTGDHVMGWAPSLVSPPDGDMSAYMASLDRLDGLGARVFHSGHGAPIVDPAKRLAELRNHRLGRERAIVAELAKGAASIELLTQRIYTELAPALRKAAARNVFAHLVDLHTRQVVVADKTLDPSACFSLATS